jgi:hypothetical protein
LFMAASCHGILGWGKSAVAIVRGGNRAPPKGAYGVEADDYMQS